MAEQKEVRVPDIGEFENVEVIEILVQPGDRVEEEQSLLTLESDKATMEIPAPFSGVIEQVLVSIGDQVSTGSAIVTMQLDDGTAAKPDATPATEAADDEAPTAEPAIETAPSAEAEPAIEPSPKPGVSEAGPAQMLSEAPPFDHRPAPSAHRAHAGPAVRRMAHELGVDLARVTGGGPKGRIRKEDVDAYVKQALKQGAQPSAPAGFAVPEFPDIDFSRWGEIEHLPLSKLKRVSARNLHRAWLTVPHVTQFDESDITELEEFRKSKQDEAKARGVSLTMLGFFLKACAVTLQDFPHLNSTLHKNGESLILKKYMHIGIAVDTERGLVVPVIRDVDKKGLFSLAEELAVVSQKARDRKLRPEDLQGGTFSISSLGGIGGTAFTPIVNAPEVAILGVARAQMKPIWSKDEERFAPRLMVPLCLSYDHRVIDGADAARFTSRLKTVLSDIRNLVL